MLFVLYNELQYTIYDINDINDNIHIYIISHIFIITLKFR